MRKLIFSITFLTLLLAMVSFAQGALATTDVHTTVCVDVLIAAATSQQVVTNKLLDWSPLDASLETNRNSLLRIREAVRTAGLGNLDEVKLVVNPYSGVDAGTTAALFPRATIIGYDMIAFAERNNSWSVKNGQVKGSSLGYATYREIDELQYDNETAAAHIVHSLRAFVPNFRLRQVTRYETPGDDEDEDIEDRLPRVHGVVEFDTGDGTLTRRYIHINGYIQTSVDAEMGFEPPFFLGQILGDQTPDAVLVKASMGRLTPARATPRLRTAIWDWLSKSKGYLIEGEEQTEDRGTPARPEFSLSEQTKIGKRIEVITPVFGYTGRAHVTRFKK